MSRGEELLKAFTFGAANRMDSALQVKEGIEKRAEYHYDVFGNRRGQDIYSRLVYGGIPDMGVEKPQDPERQIRYTLDITRPYHKVEYTDEDSYRNVLNQFADLIEKYAFRLLDKMSREAFLNLKYRI